MRKPKDQEDINSANEAATPSLEGHEDVNADDDTIIVNAPDPDFDDEYANESGQGRKMLDLDAALDLQSAMQAADASLRGRAISILPGSANGAQAPDDGIQDGESAPPAPTNGSAEADLRAQLDQERNNTLRAVADLHNFRRRVDEERSRLVLDANERLIKEILPLVDDFERSLAAARQSESYEQLVEGVEAVLRKIGDVLTRQGLEPIEALGQPFDPTIHEAVMIEEGSDQPDETVIEELRKGYKMNGRVLRPSLVKVAKS